MDVRLTICSKYDIPSVSRVSGQFATLDAVIFDWAVPSPGGTTSIWPRDWHESYFRRDGVCQLSDVLAIVDDWL